MHGSLNPYARCLKDMNLFVMPVEGFSKGRNSLKSRKRTCAREQFAVAVAASGVLAGE